jgi:hypothetical protein
MGRCWKFSWENDGNMMENDGHIMIYPNISELDQRNNK